MIKIDKLSAENVIKVFYECLFKEQEPKDNPVIVEGVMSKIGFHPGRIKEQEQNIVTMLKDLPHNFMHTDGGGWSFLNACNDKNGEQWADMHQTIDQLVCLGIAIKKVSFIAPREMWSIFPAGMPYFVVFDEQTEQVAEITN